MEVKMFKLSELVPYENNPRDNSEAVEYVANSIKEFGFKVPIIVDSDNVIVTGHTRYLASKELGLDEVPVIVADDLTDEQIKAYRIADNKVAEIAEWDMGLLESELMGIDMDMSSFGIEMSMSIDIDVETKEEKPEVEFTEYLSEEHNYVVLYFDNDIDWLQAESLFDLKTVKALNSKENYKKQGIGRVLKGSDAIKKIRGY